MRRISILLLILFTCFVSIVWPQTQTQVQRHKMIIFDVPGAGIAAGQGTMPVGIVQGDWIMGFLLTAAKQGKKVSVYGAPGKSATLLHYCGIGKDLIE